MKIIYFLSSAYVCESRRVRTSRPARGGVLTYIETDFSTVGVKVTYTVIELAWDFCRCVCWVDFRPFPLFTNKCDSLAVEGS